MNLVEAESTGPIEGDTPLVTPPRPPHRRVSVSLLFTLTVLVGTVVAIYLTFPTRNSVLMAEALQRHRAETSWDIKNPTSAELHRWATRILGEDPPLPIEAVTGVREIEILNHRAALMRFRIGGQEVSYLVQFTRVIAPEHAERSDGDLHAIAWRQGPYTCVAVGSESGSAAWVPAVRAAIRR